MTITLLDSNEEMKPVPNIQIWAVTIEVSWL